MDKRNEFVSHIQMLCSISNDIYDRNISDTFTHCHCRHGRANANMFDFNPISCDRTYQICHIVIFHRQLHVVSLFLL